MKKIYLGIFLIPLIVNPLGLEIYSASKLSWFLFFLAIFALGLVFAKKIEVKKNKKLHYYLGALIASLFLSTILSVAPIQSFFGEYHYAKGFIFYLLVIAHFLICLHLFGEKKFRKKFYKVVKVVAAILSVHAILQYFNPENAEHLYRSYATVGQPNFLAQLLIFPLFLVGFELLDDDRGEKDSYMSILLFVLIGLAIFLTKSRAVMLAIMASAYLGFLFFSDVKKLYKWLLTGGLVAIVGALPLLGFINMRSVNSRALLWSGSLDLLDKWHVFFGTGLNSFYREFVRIMEKSAFTSEQFYTTPTSPHNEILEALLERGVLGLLLYLIPIAFIFWLLFKRKVKRDEGKVAIFAILAYLISVQLSFSTVEHFVYLAGFFAILFLEQLEFEKVKNVMKGIVWKVMLALVAVCLFVTSLLILKTDLLLAKGIENYVTGEEGAFEVFEEAISSTPVFTFPRKIVIKLFSGETHAELVPHLEAYKRISGEDYYYNILAMKLAAIRGNFDLVEEHYLRAAKDAPNLPILYTEAGDIYFENGDCEKVLEMYGILKSLAPVYEEGSEEKRLFEKHATGYVNAMERMEECSA